MNVKFSLLFVALEKISFIKLYYKTRTIYKFKHFYQISDYSYSVLWQWLNSKD